MDVGSVPRTDRSMDGFYIGQLEELTLHHRYTQKTFRGMNPTSRYLLVKYDKILCSMKILVTV
jgi:hypothetical protein